MRWCAPFYDGVILRFELEDGDHTEVFFYKDRKCKTHSFPSENANIVSSHGTGESKEMLDKILMDGVTALGDRTYVAFTGPPIPPYKIKCYCGHVTTFGHDKKGYYIEGASEIEFGPGGFEEEGKNEQV